MYGTMAIRLIKTFLPIWLFLVVFGSSIFAYDLTIQEDVGRQQITITNYTHSNGENIVYKYAGFEQWQRSNHGDRNDYLVEVDVEFTRFIDDHEYNLANPERLLAYTIQSNEQLQEQINELLVMIRELQILLNVTVVEEEAQLYSCVSDSNLGRECPYGLSGVNRDGLQTRCYTAQLLGKNTFYDNCVSGWVLI